MNRLQLNLFGRFEASLNGYLIEGFRYKKTIALLSFMVAESNHKHGREKLAALLWPDATFKNARSNLRFALADLRKNIADHQASPPHILINQDYLQFNLNSDSKIDIIEFGKAINQTDLSDLIGAIDLYKGSFLDGINVPDNKPFEEWLGLKRDEYLRQHMETLSRVIRLLEQQLNYEKALEYAYIQLAVEPWLEEGHQHVMRLLATIGKRSAALAQYRKCIRALAEGLGVRPGEETRKLFEAIREDSFKPIKPSALNTILVSPQTKDLQGKLREVDNSSIFLLENDQKIDTSPPFVARKQELNRLNSILNKVMSGKGQVCFIKGEPGQGKTALVHEFIRLILPAHPQVVVSKGKCQAYYGHNDHYLPFREILRLLCGDVYDQWEAGSIPGEHARRLWNSPPLPFHVCSRKLQLLLRP